MSKDEEVKISELRLDPENPRIAGEQGQINIRQAMLDDQGSKIGELASDIARHRLNPMDRMMVLQANPAKREFTTLEGNRRTVALQILANPSLLQDIAIPDALRNKLVDLSDNFDPKTVEPIQAVVMPDRESARRWIELRHTGQNDGRGIVDWNGVQTARFRGDKTLDLLEFVKMKGELTPEEKTTVGQNFPITTLDRIVSNPVVRQKLGIQITDGAYYFNYPEKEQIKSLKRIVLDLATKKIKVDLVKSKEKQIEYIDGLPKEVMPAGAKLKAATSVSDLIKAPSAQPSPPPKPAPSPLDRKTLVPKDFVLNIANSKAAQLLYELRTLNIEKFPIAGSVAFRSFVEAAVEIYCASNSIPTKHTSGKHAGKALSLAEKVEAVIVHAAPKLTKQEQTATRAALTGASSVVSIARLNEYVHNPAMFPSKNDLIAAWSGVEAFFKATCK